MQKKTKYILIGVGAFLVVGGGIRSLSSSDNSTSSVSSKITKVSSSKEYSSSVKSSSAKSNSAKSNSSKNDYSVEVSKLNTWYSDTMKKQISDDYNSNKTADNIDLFTKSGILLGFKNNNGELLAVVDRAQMNANNFSQKEMGQFAFNAIVAQYDNSDDLKIFSNYKNGYVEKPVIGDIGNYVEFK